MGGCVLLDMWLAMSWVVVGGGVCGYVGWVWMICLSYVR